MRRCISLIVIENKKLLLVNKKGIWILPGGKILENETHNQCLIREFSEELPLSKIEIYNYYKTFKGITPHSQTEFEAVCYFGTLIGEIKPAAEISDAKFINNFNNYNLSEVTKQIVESLKQDRYIKW